MPVVLGAALPGHATMRMMIISHAHTDKYRALMVTLLAVMFISKGPVVTATS